MNFEAKCRLLSCSESVIPAVTPESCFVLLSACSAIVFNKNMCRWCQEACTTIVECAFTPPGSARAARALAFILNIETSRGRALLARAASGRCLRLSKTDDDGGREGRDTGSPPAAKAHLPFRNGLSRLQRRRRRWRGGPVSSRKKRSDSTQSRVIEGLELRPQRIR